MEFTGSAYLFNLAVVAITFAGFTAIFMTLRQARSGGLTKYDLFVTRNYMMVSFLIVLGTLLPSLLAAFSGLDDKVWQIASAVVAVLLALSFVSFPYRRRRATNLPRPRLLWLQELIFAAAAVVLAANALGFPRAPNVALFEVGMTLILGGLFYSFLLTLDTSLIDRRK